MVLAHYQRTVVNTEGNPVSGATVRVEKEITGLPLAVLYEDRDGTTVHTQGNPITTDSNGEFNFYVAGGSYKITITGNGVSQTLRYVPIGLSQESDGVAPGLNFFFSSNTIDSDPGSGYIKFNNSTLASITEIYISGSDINAQDIQTYLATINQGSIYVTTTTASATIVFSVSGAGTDNGDYYTIPVSVTNSGGSFVDDVRLGFLSVVDGTDGVDGEVTANGTLTSDVLMVGNGGTEIQAISASSNSGDIDDLYPSQGFMWYKIATGATNGPAGAGVNGSHLLSFRFDTNTGRQVYYEHASTRRIYTRYRTGGTWQDWTRLIDSENDFSEIIAVFDGGGSALTTGTKLYLPIDFDCEIVQQTLLADQTGSIVIDIWKDTYANYPPTDADTITASALPTISSGIKDQDSTLTGWTTTISAGDVLGFNIDSITTITYATLALKVKRI